MDNAAFFIVERNRPKPVKKIEYIKRDLFEVYKVLNYSSHYKKSQDLNLNGELKINRYDTSRIRCTFNPCTIMIIYEINSTLMRSIRL